eukprot:4312428-Prorocentrum_lima.AAC.1
MLSRRLGRQGREQVHFCRSNDIGCGAGLRLLAAMTKTTSMHLEKSLARLRSSFTRRALQVTGC